MWLHFHLVILKINSDSDHIYTFSLIKDNSDFWITAAHYVIQYAMHFIKAIQKLNGLVKIKIKVLQIKIPCKN